MKQTLRRHSHTPGTPSLHALPAIAEVLTISRTRLPASNLLILRSPDRMISLKPKSDISLQWPPVPVNTVQTCHGLPGPRCFA